MDAVDAYRAALEVYTETNSPRRWAGTLQRLGTELANRADKSSGQEAGRLLRESEGAYRRTLDVFTKQDEPQSWAAIENNLGAILQKQAKQSNSAEAARLLGNAADAYRAALEVYTKADPEASQNWAKTKVNLGRDLQTQGMISNSPGAAKLFGEAAVAYRAALDVFTRAAQPRDWAQTQFNLGTALAGQAKLSNQPDAAPEFGQAAEAYRRSLDVYTRADQPQVWARLQLNLGVAMEGEAKNSRGSESQPLFEAATAAFRGALEVYTRAEMPQLWAATQNGLGVARLGQAKYAGGPEGAQMRGEALTAFRGALRAFVELEDWSGAAESAEDTLEMTPDSADVLKLAEAIYQSRLFEFEKAFDLNRRRLSIDKSLGARIDFAEKHLTTARFGECLTRWSEFTTGEIDESLFAVRDGLRFACEYAAGKSDLALHSAEMLLKAAENLRETGRAFLGVERFVSDHPTFSAA